MNLICGLGIRSVLGLLFVLFVQIPGHAQNFTNPILPGGYPDPSICRVGNDYYLVNSTFEYFPGLPIHHSRDLVNWKLIGHGLHRKEQVTGAVNLVDVQSDGGIHAPTIRCRDGKFYIITTNVYSPIEKDKPTEFVNFVITADKPEGPWSDPIVFEGAPGIDPDIFFDDDGKVWYAGTHSPEKPNFPGEGEIWLQEIDTNKWKLIGERFLLWRGACGGTWAEGPHLYKRDGRYYLLVAEGGTHFNHGVMIAVSDKITGPYESNPRNPILSSRHLSYDNWVHSTGHGDLMELEDGRWFMVALGIRGDIDRASNMGRETHLIPVRWEREPYWWKEVKYEWPVAAPETGRVERFSPLPFPASKQQRNDSFVDNFDSSVLNLEWNFRRYPPPGIYSLEANPGHLRLFAKPEVIAERGRASLMGFRQKETDFDYTVKMRFEPAAENVEAGINLFQKDDNYIAFVVEKRDGKHFQKLVLTKPKEAPRVFKQQIISAYKGEILLRVSSRDGSYDFDFSRDQGASFENFTQVGRATIDILSKGYTGAQLGVFATSNGKLTEDFADFDWVEYKGFPRG